jgi:hypothetical protein
MSMRAWPQFPKVFCSEECEQEFIRAALSSLTVEGIAFAYMRASKDSHLSKRLPFERKSYLNKFSGINAYVDRQTRITSPRHLRVLGIVDNRMFV